jgi:hypothetical protein
MDRRRPSGGGVSQGNELRMAILGSDAAARNDATTELQQAISNNAPDLEVKRVREDDKTQDFGATLVLVLGSAAATQLARGIAVWLARRQDAHLQLEKRHEDGSVVTLEVDGSMSRRAERVIAGFLDGSDPDSTSPQMP